MPFIPEELGVRLLSARKRIVDKEWPIDIEESPDLWLAAEGKGGGHYDADSKIEVSLPDCDTTSLAVSEVVRIVEELGAASHVDSRYRTKTQLLVHVRPVNRTAENYHYFRSGIDGSYTDDPPRRTASRHLLSTTGDISVGLTFGFTAFAVALAAEGYYDKYNPPYRDGDMFVDVRFPAGCNISVVDEVVRAYIYELSEDLEFDLVEAPIGTVEDGPDPDEERVSLELEQSRRRPLKQGKGIVDLLAIYQAAIAHGDDAEYAFVNYAKVLEFVSATAIKLKGNALIRQKLMSPAALDPTATYIAELIGTVESLRAFKKDAEALKLTIETCCDPLELASVAPDHLSVLKKLESSSTTAERERALATLSATITATRNQLSHAKANYQLTGDEYPLGELDLFIPCIRIAAQQAVRWYSQTDPALRLV